MMKKLLVVLHTTTIILLVLALPLQSGVVAAFSTIAVVVEPKKSSRIRNHHYRHHHHHHHRVAVPPPPPQPPATMRMMIANTAPPPNENDDNININSDQQAQEGDHHSRRSALSHMTAGITLTFSSFFPPMDHRRALAAASSTIPTTSNTAEAVASISSNGQELEKRNVYFGAGCFWHVQHEMILAERKILHRKDEELTSLTGYAGGGGRGTDNQGRVCYHNFQSIADYGQLGHGEVVGMTIPTNAVGEFAEEYFKLFGTKGERADPMDKGGEYR